MLNVKSFGGRLSEFGVRWQARATPLGSRLFQSPSTSHKSDSADAVKLPPLFALTPGCSSVLSATSRSVGRYTERAQTLRLANMQAMLFFENTGKFSPDVFTNQVNLWNTPIEGASREGASESMLVVVEIRTEGEGWLPRNRKVQLTARYRIADRSGFGKSAFFTKTMTINVGSEDKFFAAFWLYEQVAIRLTHRATLGISQAAKERTRCWRNSHKRLKFLQR